MRPRIPTTTVKTVEVVSPVAGSDLRGALTEAVFSLETGLAYWSASLVLSGWSDYSGSPALLGASGLSVSPGLTSGTFFQTAVKVSSVRSPSSPLVLYVSPGW